MKFSWRFTIVNIQDNKSNLKMLKDHYNIVSNFQLYYMINTESKSVLYFIS